MDTNENMLSNNEILIAWLPFFEKLFKKWDVEDDCRQICYLDFLQYDNTKLNKLNKSGELRYWITRFIKNQWFSKTSHYYAQIRRYYDHHTELPESED